MTLSELDRISGEVWEKLCSADKMLAVRHGPSAKEVRDTYGGNGEPLTPRGRAQATAAATRARELVGESLNIFGSDALQVSETAACLISDGQGEFHQDSKLNGIGLGVLHGSSLAERRTVLKRDALSLEQWRTGGLPLGRLHIPGAENPNSFCLRVLQGVSAWVDHGCNVFVATRSTMILLQNLSDSQGALDLDKYYSSEWEPLEGFRFGGGPQRVRI